jgi:hypothetical protein
MPDSPQLVQNPKVTIGTGVTNLTSANMDNTPKANNDLLVIARTNGTPAGSVVQGGSETWIGCPGMVWAGSGSPILYVYRYHLAADGQVTFSLSGLSAGPIRIVMLEIEGADPENPVDAASQDTAGTAGADTNRTVGPLSAPRTLLPGLMIAAAVWNPSPAVAAAWNNGFTQYDDGATTGSLQWATKVDVGGTGPYQTNVNWGATGYTPREALVRFVAPEDGAGLDLNRWVSGRVVD